MEAKKFLADKITLQAAMEEMPFSEGEQKLLLFSEEDPESPAATEIPDDLLYGDNEKYEEKVIRLLRAAYSRDQENPLEREKYGDAMQTLKGSDHYILVIAEPALAR